MGGKREDTGFVPRVPGLDKPGLARGFELSLALGSELSLSLGSRADWKSVR